MEVLTRKRLSDGTEIFTIKGTKGRGDFIVKATFPSGRSITPKHAHFVIDLYGKLCQNPELGKMIFELIKRAYEGKTAEEVLQGLGEEDKKELANSVGYSIEYVLHCLELIFKQEEINYPQPRYKGKRLPFEMLEDVVNGMHPVEAMKKAQLKV